MDTRKELAKPIPLSDPNGVTWAYQCGYCRMIHHHDTSAKRVLRPDSGRLVNCLHDAIGCCRCRSCGGLLETEFLTNRKKIGSWTCDACAAALAPKPPRKPRRKSMTKK